MKYLRRVIFLWVISLCFLMPAMAQTASFAHTVEKGETVYSIAKIYNIASKDILSLNPAATQGIRPGDALRIPQKNDQTNTQRFHTVLPGETLYKLTQIYQVKAEDICKVNPGLSANNFKAGEVIIIPSANPEILAQIEKEKTEELQRKSNGLPRSNCKEMHKVARRETIYGIAKEYGLTETELMNANPEMKDPEYKLKKGKFICIPYPRKATTIVPDGADQFPKSADIQKMNLIKIGVILPFKRGNNESQKMLEFYQGLLLAVNKIKQEGVSVDVYTFDSGTTPGDINKLLSSPVLSTLHVIFGPLYADQVLPLSEFCKKNSINLVVPFTSQSDAVYNNPYLYMINAPKEIQTAEVNERMASVFTSQNMIVVESGEQDKEKEEFIKGLKNYMQERGIQTKLLSIEGGDMEMQQAFNQFRDNLIIPNSGSIKTLNKLFAKLKNFTKEHPEYRIKLMGYPEWQTYTSTQLENFYTFDTYIYTPFYRNPLSGTCAEFEKNYTNWFKKNMMASYPRFGFLGYDTGYYFLHGMSKYGKAFDKNLKNIKIEAYQHNFRFTRMSNWSGFINKNIEFVHYTPAHSIELINIKE